MVAPAAAAAALAAAATPAAAHLAKKYALPYAKKKLKGVGMKIAGKVGGALFKKAVGKKTYGRMRNLHQRVAKVAGASDLGLSHRANMNYGSGGVSKVIRQYAKRK